MEIHFMGHGTGYLGASIRKIMCAPADSGGTVRIATNRLDVAFPSEAKQFA